MTEEVVETTSNKEIMLMIMMALISSFTAGWKSQFYKGFILLLQSFILTSLLARTGISYNSLQHDYSQLILAGQFLYRAGTDHFVLLFLK